MANRQVLPNMNLNVQAPQLSSVGAGQVVAPKWEEEKYKTLSSLSKGVVGISEAYKGLRHTEMAAKMDNIAQQELFKLQNVNDPSEIPNIVNTSYKAFDDMYKDDPYGKSFYNSELYFKFRDGFEANVIKESMALQKKFDLVQASRTANELSSDIALMTDPRRMSNAVNSYINQVKTLNFDPLEEEKLISQFTKDSFGKVFTNNPNNALNWYNASNGEFDKYGVDGADLIEKAKNYNKALEREKRAIENYEYTKKQREQTAKTNYYKSQILQNPDMTESILSKALLEDDKIYVDLSEFVKKNTPKSSQRSQLSKDFTKAYAEKGVEGAEEFIKNNPNAVNDPNTMTAYENVKKLNKSESDTEALLKDMQDAFSEGKYEEFRTNHLAEILAVDKTRTADSAYKEELKVSSNADDYTLLIANSNNVDNIDYFAEQAMTDDTLTSKEKASIAKYRNTRISQIENKADKKETKIQKQQKEKITEESAKAYGEILLEQNNGSEAIENKFNKLKDKLTITDKNKAIALYNKIAKEEGKEQKDLLKEVQETNYNKLMGDYRDGNLSQDKIDDAFENEDISITHKEKLEQTLYKAEIKQAEQTKKDNKEQALKTIYNADVNGETVDVSKLSSQDADVIKTANSVNLKNGKRVYINEKNNIFGEMLDNSMPNDEVIEGWKNRLIEKNYIGNTELPEQWIENTLTSIRGIEQSKASFVKSKIDTLFGKPINGKSFSEYETSLKDLAYKEALNLVAAGKTPNFEEIYKNHKPTKEGLNLYYQTRDNAYYGQIGIRDNIFEKRTITEGDSKDKVQSSYYSVKKGIKASQYIDYIKTIENNREEGYYTDAQYKELFKPVAINKGYILNTLAEDNIKTVEGRVARKLKEINGNKIGNPNDFYEDFWSCISFVEGKGEERSDRYNPWIIDEVERYVVEWYKTTKAQAPNTISE